MISRNKYSFLHIFFLVSSFFVYFFVVVYSLLVARGGDGIAELLKTFAFGSRDGFASEGSNPNAAPSFSPLVAPRPASSKTR